MSAPHEIIYHAHFSAVINDSSGLLLYRNALQVTNAKKLSALLERRDSRKLTFLPIQGPLSNVRG